jgi:LEA14-like dessication related protein
MSVRGVDADGFTLDFAVDLANPNAVALPVATADYELGMGGVRVLGGEAKPQRSIPAHGSGSVTVPVGVSFEQLLKAESAIRDSGGNVPYDLSGGLTFDTGTPLVGRVRVPLRHSGTVPLRQILSDPQVLLQSPAAKRLAAAVLGRFFGN